MLLQHGTTKVRAERILRDGPEPGFLEPGGAPGRDGFSTALASGPFPLGTPADYARSKDRAFPGEGGPAILEVDVPDAIVALAVNDWFPLSQGLVQFDVGAGLEALVAAWPGLVKRVLPVSGP